jgi:hypothetical protein
MSKKPNMAWRGTDIASNPLTKHPSLDVRYSQPVSQEYGGDRTPGQPTDYFDVSPIELVQHEYESSGHGAVLSTHREAEDRSQPQRRSTASTSYDGHDFVTAPKRSRKPLRHRWTSFLQSWGWELAGIATSLLTLAAIVIILFVYDGRAQDAWTSQGTLTLNGLIALLATISRACMAVAVAGCISQHQWFWFASSDIGGNGTGGRGRPLSDLVHFDEASRGAVWGCIEVLWKTKGRYVNETCETVSRKTSRN